MRRGSGSLIHRLPWLLPLPVELTSGPDALSLRRGAFPPPHRWASLPGGDFYTLIRCLHQPGGVPGHTTEEAWTAPAAVSYLGLVDW